MKKRRMTLDEIKKLEIDMLTEYKRFCEKNGFYYTLCGGTLLGAIRHKGFIPWDDDIDVFLSRADYNKILDGTADFSSLPKYMKFISHRDNESPYPFIKLVDTRTDIRVDYFDKKKNITHIWIDIFPVDPIPDNDNIYRKIVAKSTLYRKILTLKMAKNGEGKTYLKRILKPIVKVFLMPISIKMLCDKIDKLCEPYWNIETKNVACCVWGYGFREKVDREGYEKSVPVEFEGKMFEAPSNWETYLTKLYGDYMQLPPVEKRVPHGIEAYMITK